MNVRVDSCNWCYAHGRKPEGVHCWVFEAADGKCFYYTGTYAEAKEQVKKDAAVKGYSQVMLKP